MAYINNYTGQYKNLSCLLPCGRQMNGKINQNGAFSLAFKLHQRKCDLCESMGKNAFKEAINRPPDYHYEATKHSATHQSFISAQLSNLDKMTRSEK